MKNITSLQDFQQTVEESTAVLFYFSHNDCNVCKVLLPKVKSLLEEEFPKMKFCYCNTKDTPKLAAQNRIFTVPSVLIFIDGKQHFQFSRNFSIGELANAIQRPYQLIFT